MVRTRDEWTRIRANGIGRYVAIGALRHGIPMTIVVVVALELLSGGTFSRERLQSPEFLERVVLCFAVFLTSGAVSAFARWKSIEALFGKEGDAS